MVYEKQISFGVLIGELSLMIGGTYTEGSLPKREDPGEPSSFDIEIIVNALTDKVLINEHGGNFIDSIPMPGHWHAAIESVALRLMGMEYPGIACAESLHKPIILPLLFNHATPKSKRGAGRMYNTLYNAYRRDYGGDPFGLDWSTLRINRPTTYYDLKVLQYLITANVLPA